MSSYLYNGIVFPEPPAWDDYTYPYAAIYYVIFGDGSYMAEFLYSNEPFAYHKETGYCTPPESAIVYRCPMDVYNRSGFSISSDTDWGEPFTFPELTSMYEGCDYVWTNTPIYSDDGKLYLGATEPTPLAKEKRVRQAWYSTTDQERQKCPALPEWDKENYLYALMAMIENDGFNTFFLYLSNEPFYVNTEELSVQTSTEASVLCCKYQSNFDVGIWDRPVLVYGDIKLNSPVGIVWTNSDIVYDPSDKVAFRSYNPILLGYLDLKSWLYGFVLGLTGMPLPLKIGAAPTPTAYSYNGVILPKLPEWDREKYPYAVIKRTNLWRTRLHINTEKSTIEFNQDGVPLITHGLQNFLYLPSTDEWESELNTTSFDRNAAEYFVWANHDVLYDDGTVFAAASDPIPVYE